MSRNLADGVHRRTGFTFVELVVVIAIVLILAGMAAPSLQGSITRGRVQAAALQLAQDLRLVRENAITYQDDLCAYVSMDTGVSGCYYYEKLPHLGSNGLPDGSHNTPPVDGAALPDQERFVRKDLPFNMQVLSATSADAPVTYGGHQYHKICFRSGTQENVIPGSVAASVTVVVGGSGSYSWKVVVDTVGRTHIQQQ